MILRRQTHAKFPQSGLGAVHKLGNAKIAIFSRRPFNMCDIGRISFEPQIHPLALCNLCTAPSGRAALRECCQNQRNIFFDEVIYERSPTNLSPFARRFCTP